MTGKPNWTEIDRLTYADLAHDIAFAVADGRDPRPEDVARFRRLTNRRDAFIGAEQSFELSRGLGVAERGVADDAAETVVERDPECAKHAEGGGEVTRDEAIDYIWRLSDELTAEVYVDYDTDKAAAEVGVADALRALGVTQEEMDARG
jgi:hypothetical protein